MKTIAAKIRRLINSVMTLSRNIVEMFVAVLLDITQYELVPAPGSPGTSRCI